MSNYGLQLRKKPLQQKKQPAKLPMPSVLGFGDDDEDDVNKEIARQATKKKVMKDIEEQHKKALEEDPSVFDYDGVYEQMKEEMIRPLVQERQEKKSKYIQTLMEKAKERERQHEIIYERKLVKERNKEDHLFADKDKFVTSAYKKKLAEQEKWLMEEQLRERRELKDDVTKKNDISDFYFNLTKNVAFGAKVAQTSRQAKQEEEAKGDTSGKQASPNEAQPNMRESGSQVKQEEEAFPGTSTGPPANSCSPETSPHSENNVQTEDKKSELNINQKGNTTADQLSSDQNKLENHKRSQDAVAAAKDGFWHAREQKKLIKVVLLLIITFPFLVC